ncbi:MAG: Gx transporter family protein [Candidatus Nitrohelix vancouverensis]|uniref:Gx transporter family protein n=1 Tax=Candidatus Nitrohelix vancouverensis TaxID=2705534 RepID=A0A7T0C0G0_9BACT|nr:MAG: Gx transporter family protein [Candidatus Nitrohelix vancouverensis]
MPTQSEAVSTERRLLIMATLVALGVVLHRLEALLPLPSPWIKLGLANVMTLVALVYLGVKEAFIVAILRVFWGSILGGTFMSPTFFLSFAGTLSATLAMACFYAGGRGPFSLIGVCVASAYAHTATAFFCVYGFLSTSTSFLKLIPLFSCLALVSGVLTGLVANDLARRLEAEGIALK